MKLESVKCNLCGSDDYKVLYSLPLPKEDINQVFRASGDSRAAGRIVRCKSCGLAYTNPRIKAESIVKGYSEGSDETFVSQEKARVRTFAKSMRLIEKYSKKGKILDVGTAGGSFLFAAKQRGWEVYGMEVNKWLAEWGKKNYGIGIRKGTLEQQKYKKEFFDAVTLWDVLEHVPDPKSTLRECGRVLKKGGTLLINYPDFGSLASKAMGKRWVFLTAVHIYYFERKSLSKMLRAAGFRVVYSKPYFQTLSLGYLMFRFGTYSKLMQKLGTATVKALGISKLEIPYWLGQTMVIARKI